MGVNELGVGEGFFCVLGCVSSAVALYMYFVRGWLRYLKWKA